MNDENTIDLSEEEEGNMIDLSEEEEGDQALATEGGEGFGYLTQQALQEQDKKAEAPEIKAIASEIDKLPTSFLPVNVYDFGNGKLVQLTQGTIEDVKRGPMIQYRTGSVKDGNITWGPPIQNATNLVLDWIRKNAINLDKETT